ncbi:hypothetical protein JTB14_022181 [Gonioctena quinquepunctata]|nr:hypothetical protein JTB14_022181 [Gonioctena quinquepunctata]
MIIDSSRSVKRSKNKELGSFCSVPLGSVFEKLVEPVLYWKYSKHASESSGRMALDESINYGNMTSLKYTPRRPRRVYRLRQIDAPGVATTTSNTTKVPRVETKYRRKKQCLVHIWVMNS